MAQYKVIQDIEAEDKLVGPFSLRQFIYAAIAALFGYLCAIAIGRGAPFLLAIFVPPMLFCAFFAWPWTPDQPTEVWALARIRFYFKPRRRIWDQTGVKDLVTITVPKKVQKVFTNGLSQTEVRSRLSALAETIDSRGWVIRETEIGTPQRMSYDQSASDRLVPAGTMPQPVSDTGIQAADDILDAQNNPVAQQFDHMIQASSAAHRQRLLDQMRAPQQAANSTPQSAQPTADYWFLNQPSQQNNSVADPTSAVFANPVLVQPGNDAGTGPVSVNPSASDEAMGEQLLQENRAKKHSQKSHLKTINPLDQTQASDTSTANQTNQPAPVTAQSDAAILNLANNDDLDVATLARQAAKARNPEPPEDEVVISLR